MPTLMVSISGIRGIVGDGLDPEVLVKYVSAYADLCGQGKVIVGRDSRISGEMVVNVVTGTLLAKGLDVIDLGICPTPTVLFNVKTSKAAGGIAITASHNPNEWNALKLLNDNGEFLTSEQNEELMRLIDKGTGNFMPWNKLGKLNLYPEGLKDHLDAVLNLDIIDVDEIRKRKFKVLLDCVNGAGVYVMPELLRELGCEVIEMNCERNGIFPRLPEPLPENLKDTMEAVKAHDADIGIVVDPDVDRLVLICEDGNPFGEEYTIAQAVKFVLSKNPGNVVINMSTTRAVGDIANEYGCKLFRSPVGEANVVRKMKEVDAVIGGEGSGGVIYPALQYGRDALAGTVLTLQHMLEFGGTLSELKSSLPEYHIVKNKVEMDPEKADNVLSELIEKYKSEQINTEDGLRIDFDDHWLHIRKSNTEPILRIMVEAGTIKSAKEYMNRYLAELS